MSEVPPSAPVYSTTPAAVPGKTLGIVALIVSFFFQLIALILGFVALSQSRKVGAKNTPAVVAIVLSIIFGIGWIAVTIGLIVGGVGLFGGIIDQCAELGNGTHEVDGVTYECNLPE